MIGSLRFAEFLRQRADHTLISILNKGLKADRPLTMDEVVRTIARN